MLCSRFHLLLTNFSDLKSPYMNLNGNRTMCHLSSRVDVGNHFVSSGGFEGSMESYDKLVTRMVSFHKKYLDLDNFKMFNENMKLVGQLQDLCYSNYENGIINDKSDIVVDLYQFDLVLLLAGQEIPMHLDVPFFFGADRTTVPQWLLVVMKQSGLFDDLFIPDIKGIAWLTKHNVYNGGHAYLYPYKNDKNKPILFRTQLNEALLFDGTQMIHGSSRFKPEYIPSFFNHDNYYYSMKYNDETRTWHVYDSDNKFSASYTYDDIQISAVWRMHCFKNANEKAKFYAQTTENTRSIEKIAQVFKSALKQKNLLPSGDIKYLDLWTIILKEYISYPKVEPKSKFSLFNYCLLPRIMPDFVNRYVLDFFLSRFC
jgi:hypothetical protein